MMNEERGRASPQGWSERLEAIRTQDNARRTLRETGWPILAVVVATLVLAGGALWLHWSTAPLAVRAAIFLPTYLAVYFGICTFLLRRRLLAAQLLLGGDAASERASRR